jgi:hypothetical protein
MSDRFLKSSVETDCMRLVERNQLELIMPSKYAHYMAVVADYDPTTLPDPHYLRYIRVGGIGDLVMDVVNVNALNKTENVTLTITVVGEVFNTFLIKKIYAAGSTATKVFVS